MNITANCIITDNKYIMAYLVNTYSNLFSIYCGIHSKEHTPNNSKVLIKYQLVTPANFMIATRSITIIYGNKHQIKLEKVKLCMQVTWVKYVKDVYISQSLQSCMKLHVILVTMVYSLQVHGPISQNEAFY